jgi:hypothetical protein
MSLTFRACEFNERRVAGEDFLADLAAALSEERGTATTEEQIEGHLENELAEDLVENTRLTDHLATVTKVAEGAVEEVEELEELEEVEESVEESAERGIMDAEYYADAANEYDYGYYSPSNNYDYYYDHDVQYTSYDSDY